MKEDFLPIKNKFESRSNFTFKSFHGLNHFFGNRTGCTAPVNDYYKPEFVSEEAIETIANWIEKLERGH